MTATNKWRYRYTPPRKDPDQYLWNDIVELMRLDIFLGLWQPNIH